MFFRRKQHEQELARLRAEAQLQSELASAAMATAAELRRGYEARVADLKEAGEQRAKEMLRTIKALAEEVEFLRTQHFGARNVSAPTARDIPVMPEEVDFMPFGNPHYLSEEAEDIEALHAGGHIDAIERRAALAQIQEYVRGPIHIEATP